MLKMNLTTNHAIRAMLHIAKQEGKVVVRDEMIKELAVPPKAFGNMMKTLVLNSLLFSFRGTGGGFRLTRPAAEITLREVVEAIEGKITVNACLRDEAHCNRTAGCSAHDVWREVQQRLLAKLGSVTLAQLLIRPPGCDCGPFEATDPLHRL